jgi:glycosyltransferase involved in cell wall biosynthesis
MACGTPALISAETVRAMPGVEGVVFASELDEASLDAALGEVLERPEQIVQRRQACAEFARRHWNWEACAQAYLELFRRLTSGR